MPSLKPCMTARRWAAARSMRACHCAVSRLSTALAFVETSCIAATPLRLDNQADPGSHCTWEIASARLAWLGGVRCGACVGGRTTRTFARLARESGHPGAARLAATFWAPAFAGATILWEGGTLDRARSRRCRPPRRRHRHAEPPSGEQRL